MKYKVIIKNNETNEVIFENDVNAMVAGMAAQDTPSSILLQGDHEEMIVAINMVEAEVARIFEEDL